MSQYRIYVLSESNHINSPPADVELPDDAAVIQQARLMADVHAIEVWERARLVVRVAAKNEPEFLAVHS